MLTDFFHINVFAIISFIAPIYLKKNRCGREQKVIIVGNRFGQGDERGCVSPP